MERSSSVSISQTILYTIISISLEHVCLYFMLFMQKEHKIVSIIADMFCKVHLALEDPYCLIDGEIGETSCSHLEKNRVTTDLQMFDLLHVWRKRG